ncbi:unnamed protein product [Linum trigynum]|uniref:Uncharacterized protein n=1 Tax=Linum trigynum TaxID=586398 RepID=A0AAV2EQJ0_9ROSI
MRAVPYSPLWRKLRRLTAVELFSTARLNAVELLSTACLNSSLSLRHDEVKQLVRGLFDKVSGVGSGFGKVEMKSRLSGLSLNILMRMVARKRYCRVFQEVISEVFELSGAWNPAHLLN